MGKGCKARGVDEVVVKVVAASVDPGTWHLMAGRPYAMRAPASVCARRRRSLMAAPSGPATAPLAAGEMARGTVFVRVDGEAVPAGVGPNALHPNPYGTTDASRLLSVVATTAGAGGP
jgi:hypothetical protein